TPALKAELVSIGQLTGTRYRNQLTVIPNHMLQVMQADGTGALDLDAVLSRCPACRTPDVEGTHGQLGTRLTARLGRDNTDRLTDIDLMTTCQAASVAGGAHAVAAFARYRRSDIHFVDTVLLEVLTTLLIDQRAGVDDEIIGARPDHATGDDSTQYALTQRLDDIAAFDMRLHDQ